MLRSAAGDGASSAPSRRLAFAGLLQTSGPGLGAAGVVNVSLMPDAAGLGLPGIVMGLVFAAHRVVRIAAAPLVGTATDRYGRRWPLLVGVAGVAASFLVLAVAADAAALLGARTLYGLAKCLVTTAGLAAVIDLSARGGRGGAVGVSYAALFAVYLRDRDVLKEPLDRGVDRHPMRIGAARESGRKSS